VISRTPLKGGEEREDGRGKEGIRDTDGEEGVVWDREGEEGTELGGLYRGKGWERRKGMEEGGEERKKMTWPPNKIPGSATVSYMHDDAISIVHTFNNEN
jgi:hypothetical protein